MSSPTPEPDALAAAHRTWSRLDAFHVIGFFATETRERYKALGLRPRYAYFVSRVAPMGPVPAQVCAAVFYVFHPGLVSQAMDGAWDVVSPEKVLAERYAGTREALDRVLADVAAEPGHAERVEEAAALARRACEGLSMNGRALSTASFSTEGLPRRFGNSRTRIIAPVEARARSTVASVEPSEATTICRRSWG